MSRKYEEEAFGSEFLDSIKEWMAENFDPEEIYDYDNIIEYITNNFNVSEVYSKKSLEEWAEKNEYVKKDEE